MASKASLHTARNAALVLGCAALSALVGFSGCNQGNTSAAADFCAGCCNGCSSPPPAPKAKCIDDAAPAMDAFTVVVGYSNGESPFEVIKPDMALPISYGDQGGRHIWIALHVFTMMKGDYQYEIRWNGNAGIQEIFSTCAAPEWTEILPIPAFLPDDFGGEPLKLQVHVGPKGEKSLFDVEIPIKTK